ncbi:MAG: DUF362 domain-containing protein [Candidatus Hodarchaeales archaeon]|jgi:uncharacterized Fe-S center protein
MKKSKVFMINAKDMHPGNSLIDRFKRLWNHNDVDLKEWIQPGDKVLIKTHFGSTNQTRHLRPMYIRKIADLIRKTGGIPWVGEATGLGWTVKSPESTMTSGPGYMTLAEEHGYTSGSMQAPIVIVDGVWGTDVRFIHNEKGKHIKDVAVAMGMLAADKVLIVSRFKGHDGAGFGGALKQLGIGCVGKQGKGVAHFGGAENIKVNPDNCTACEKCIRTCPTGALSLDGDGGSKLVFDVDLCIACIHCFDICNADKPELENRVFRLHKRVPSDKQVESMMDNAGGVVKLIGEDRLRYINIAIDITSHCDCMPAGGSLLVPDQGILYSKDPIAIDQASVDLVTEAKGLPESPAETGIHFGNVNIDAEPSAMEAGKEKLGLFSAWVNPEFRSTIADIQLSHSVAQGIGSRKYELIDVTKIEKEEKD